MFVPSLRRQAFLASWATVLLMAWPPALSAAAGDKPPSGDEDSPARVAERWFVALTVAKLDETLALSDVPFSWDRKQLIEALPDLKAMYEQMLRKKGARKVPPVEIEVVQQGQADKLLPKIYLGKDVNEALVVVRIMIGKEALDVIVKPGRQPKVVGFSD